MNDKIIRQVVLLGTLAIIGIVIVQSYWLINTWNTQEEEFDLIARIALRETAEELAVAEDSVAIPDRDLIKRKTSNYYIVNFNNIINPSNLEHYLQKNLEKYSFRF